MRSLTDIRFLDCEMNQWVHVPTNPLGEQNGAVNAIISSDAVKIEFFASVKNQGHTINIA